MSVVVVQKSPEKLIIETVSNKVVVVKDHEAIVVNAGLQGPRGLPGYGIPVGGLKYQHLTKKENDDYLVEWTDAIGGVDKEIQFNDGGTLGADVNFRWDKNTHSLFIGKPDALSNSPLIIGGTLDDYLQLSVQNTSESSNASSDIVATADSGNDDQHYVDLGINSSVYNRLGDISGPLDSYLAADGGHLFLFADTEGKHVKVAVEGELIASFTLDGIELEPGMQVTNRPEVFYGTGSPPSPTGLANGTLFFKYKVE